MKPILYSTMLLLLLVFKAWSQDEGMKYARTIHPDLDVTIKPIDQGVVEKIATKLAELKDRDPRTEEAASIRVPDYKPVIKLTSDLMKKSILNYLVALEEINKEVVKYFSELNAISELQVREGREDLVQEAYEWMRIKHTPGVQKKIQDIYNQAMKELYTLSGTLYIPMSKSVLHIKEKLDRDLALKNGLFSLCRTWMCAVNLSRDLKGYFNFIETLNTGIDFINSDVEMLHQARKEYMPPLVSGAMLEAARSLVKVGPNNNVEYSKGALAGKYMVDVLVDLPASGIIALSAIPVRFFENIFKFRNKHITGYVKVSLNVNTMDTYAADDIEKKMEETAREAAKDFPRVLFNGTDEEEKTMLDFINFRMHEVSNGMIIHEDYIDNREKNAELAKLNTELVWEVQQRNSWRMKRLEIPKLVYSFKIPKNFVKKYHQVRTVCEDMARIIQYAIYPIREKYGRDMSLPYYLPGSRGDHDERTCTIEMPSYDIKKIKKFQSEHVGEVLVRNREFNWDMLWWPKYQKKLIRHVLEEKHLSTIFSLYGLKFTIDEYPGVPLFNGLDEFRARRWSFGYSIQVLPEGWQEVID